MTKGNVRESNQICQKRCESGVPSNVPPPWCGSDCGTSSSSGPPSNKTTKKVVKKRDLIKKRPTAVRMTTTTSIGDFQSITSTANKASVTHTMKRIAIQLFQTVDACGGRLQTLQTLPQDPRPSIPWTMSVSLIGPMFLYYHLKKNNRRRHIPDIDDTSPPNHDDTVGNHNLRHTHKSYVLDNGDVRDVRDRNSPTFHTYRSCNYNDIAIRYTLSIDTNDK